ncbi:hypothetical protein [Sphingomonas sp. CARO-RG-8B-R24-01]|uniref:hypothetical protein n=1 Tax=Sphingomonas sp. CARO-RG-8B-R24-01 TaxID=2914831 RepID=UPI001F56A8CE|nr:hypothetical protein [Sphingomonas sp. CARO-RG-8B-R24-01]
MSGGTVARSPWPRLIAAIKPWYMWGWIGVERLQELRTDEGGRIESGGEGEVRYLEIQWLGVHFAVQLGRTPQAVRKPPR